MAENDFFDFTCPECRTIMSVAPQREGRRVVCAACGNAATAKRRTETTFSEKPMTDAPHDTLEGSRETYEDYQQRQEFERRLHEMQNQPPPAQGNAAMGWIVFILIFVVGNAVLFATTGFVLIPRR